MGTKPIKTSDGIKLVDEKTNQLAGSVSTKGKEAPTASIAPVYKKGEKVDHAKNVAELERAFQELDEAVDNGDEKAANEYDRARQKLDDALIAQLPEIIDNLKIGDKIDQVYLISGNPEWEGLRVEAKMSACTVTEKTLENVRKGSFTQEPETPGDPRLVFTLLSIVMLDKDTLTPQEEEEMAQQFADTMAEMDDYADPDPIDGEFNPEDPSGFGRNLDPKVFGDED